MVGSESAYQWNMWGDGDLDQGRGVQCCWICHRISPKYFQYPFTFIQNLSTVGHHKVPFLLFLTVGPHSSLYTAAVFCLHHEFVHSLFILWGHFQTSEWQRTRQRLVSRWPSGYQHWTAWTGRIWNCGSFQHGKSGRSQPASANSGRLVDLSTISPIIHWSDLGLQETAYQNLKGIL